MARSGQPQDEAGRDSAGGEGLGQRKGGRRKRREASQDGERRSAPAEGAAVHGFGGGTRPVDERQRAALQPTRPSGHWQRAADVQGTERDSAAGSRVGAGGGRGPGKWGVWSEPCKASKGDRGPTSGGQGDRVARVAGIHGRLRARVLQARRGYPVHGRRTCAAAGT